MSEKKEPAKKAEAPKKAAPKKINESALRHTLAARYKDEPLVDVSISPLYAHEFSRNQPVVLNGIRISVPTDGKVYKVPYSFALVIRNRIAAADEKFKRLSKMSNIASNLERTPGELKLFR